MNNSVDPLFKFTEACVFNLTSVIGFKLFTDVEQQFCNGNFKDGKLSSDKLCYYACVEVVLYLQNGQHTRLDLDKVTKHVQTKEEAKSLGQKYAITLANNLSTKLLEISHQLKQQSTYSYSLEPLVVKFPSEKISIGVKT